MKAHKISSKYWNCQRVDTLYNTAEGTILLYTRNDLQGDPVIRSIWVQNLHNLEGPNRGVCTDQVKYIG